MLGLIARNSVPLSCAMLFLSVFTIPAQMSISEHLDKKIINSFFLWIMFTFTLLT